ncbi:MAG: tetratricopeptide repeat protein [Desulfurivibrionaceae bacterium]|nr:tetratricopeptide repeat protein [Desulfurivibrionaceae bacterium]
MTRGDIMAEGRSTEQKEQRKIDIERKDGLLEELNLPPHVIGFIRDNARNLQIGAACLVLVVLGWTYFDYYTQSRAEQASAALHAAVGETDDAARLELLRNVAVDFSGSDAVAWSRIEQGHVAFRKGDYDRALVLFNEVAGDLDGDSPLLPLLAYKTGIAHENNSDFGQALQAYAELARHKEFAVKGMMAQGRIYELKGQKGKALEVYRAAAAVEEIGEPDRSILAEKINTLGASESASESS